MDRIEVTEHVLELIYKTFNIQSKTETNCCVTGCYDIITFEIPITKVHIFVHKKTEIGISYCEGVVCSTTYFFVDAIEKIKVKLDELYDKMIEDLTSY